ncbi:MAG: VOC family protein [Saprospiraceae bacterium]|nr:VOC family protein [Saprospiraceae bacterium]
MKRVTGIGGIFFKCNNVEQTKSWYKDHLGIEADRFGGCFQWRSKEGDKGHTAWSPFVRDTSYFQPSNQDFMVNYRVDDLEALLMDLASKGVLPVGEMVVQECGKFAWILDPDGQKIELWQPPSNFEDYCGVIQDSE